MPPASMAPPAPSAVNKAATDTSAGSSTVPPPLNRALSSQFFFTPEFAQNNPGRLEHFYEVNFPEQLGEGSFGSVHSAKCRKTGLVRAVKAIEWKAVKNPARFEREINIAKKLDHPNVVRLFETFQDAKKVYIVMELCTGKELFDRIVDEAPSGFDEMKAATYIRQILAALSYLHNNKFAHRDVKPENFLFHSKEPESSLKLIDFGLACKFEEGTPMHTKAGTAYYVAPEVLKGSYDEKCDVWSAGVISFILLCGFPPFSGDDDPQILHRVREGNFEFKSPEWDTISQGAKNLATQMLTVDPSLRPSAQALHGNSWLKYKGAPEQANLSNDFVRRLQSFQAKGRLKKVALAAVAQNLPDSQIEQLQKTFRSLDKNGDGTLSFEEIKDGLVRQGMKVPKAFDEILRHVDCNGSGSLDYTEFVAATIDQKLYRRRDICWAAFRTFDLDGDGRITRDELSKVLNSGDVVNVLGPDKIDKMIKDFDHDQDGCIDFDEFCQMMAPTDDGNRRRTTVKSLSLSPTAKRRRADST
eukprot:TRINITY_DN69264_c0_g1_i1.p1 TRINITY_DN69264_c0_g1~~TRINITY_DN69264_c0_g1_i1.p1  ORF type:complete len:566 (+),score=114.07 TRINITY_DN69264_c0_g1_i1:117-1700(+)